MSLLAFAKGRSGGGMGLARIVRKTQSEGTRSLNLEVVMIFGLRRQRLRAEARAWIIDFDQMQAVVAVIPEGYFYEG